MLDTDLVEVKKFGKYWRIMWKIKCKHLKKDKDGNYYCDIYNTDKRPWFCKTYPDHCFDDIDILRGESEICPIIKNLLEKTKKTNGDKK